MSDIVDKFRNKLRVVSQADQLEAADIIESLRAQVETLQEENNLLKSGFNLQPKGKTFIEAYKEVTQENIALKEQNALLTKEKPNELISALKQAYLVIYKLYEHYDSSETAYGFAETLATIDKALANYATHSGVAVQEPEGWKLVPIEPTKKMIEAARTHYESQAYTGAVSTYKAMLATAPTLDKE